jgi:glutamyl-Q tRNA(Asp) synthetase
MMTPQGASHGQGAISPLSTGGGPRAGVVTRFAPSPTGRLHLGHAYSALMAHDFARARGGAFLLRIEDIDSGRSRAEHVAGILEDLAWLGLDWDGEVVLQSARLSLYREALARLVRQGIEAEIAASAAAPHPGSESGAGGPEGPVYPGTCRRLTVSARERLVAEKPHAWRLDMAKARPAAGLEWQERGRPVAADPTPFGDVVLARKDAPVSYHLAVTVDDAAQGVSDVVRGEDLFAATHVHRLLQALLDLPTPRYHHHKLVTDEHGRRLAKRHGAPTLAVLRSAGADPADLREKLRSGRLPAGYSAPAT